MARFTRFACGGIVLAGLTLSALRHPGAETVKLTSVSVDLPSGDRGFPAGPNVDLVSANCLTCHSVGMVMTQPRLTRATWEAEVNKMIQVYKAPIQAADVPAIVAYLAAVKG